MSSPSSPSISYPTRIVFLIDLDPLLLSSTKNPNRDAYITAILRSVDKILSFRPLFNSLFAFKLFFSSLPPILSTSRIHRLLGKNATFLSFDLNAPTSFSLTQTLKSIPSQIRDGEFLPPPRASLVVESLVQLGLECCWDQNSDCDGGGGRLCVSKQNLLLLFSPIQRLEEKLAEFLGVKVSDELMVNKGPFVDVFSRIFAPASAVFARSGVHLSWIDVNIEESGLDWFCFRLFKKGIENIGWSVCSTDAIVLGSTLTPFGLIFPCIGYNFGFEKLHCVRKVRAELSLEISDVSGKPLECKCTDVEVLDLGLHEKALDISSLLLTDSANSTVRLCIKEVCMDAGANVNAKLCGLLLLRDFYGERTSEADMVTSADFLGDRILELLSTEFCKFTVGRPVLPLVLAFLYRRNLCASVYISGSDGCSLMGIMKPFTVHSAFLSIFYSDKDGNRPFKSSGITNLLGVQSASQIGDSDPSIEKGKRSKKRLEALCDKSWSSFRNMAYRQSTDDGSELEEVYFVNGRDIPKKMRFLQCWMRQMKKHNRNLQSQINSPFHVTDTIEETEEGAMISQQEMKSLVSTSPVRVSQPDQADIGPSLCAVEDIKSFEESIAQKIDHGLFSEKVDLGNLAERLIQMSIHALFVEFQKNVPEDQVEDSEVNHDLEVATEVMKLLLVKPKYLAAKYKDSNILTTAPNLSSTCSMNKKVREHELQIRFRMEILRSSIGKNIEDNTREKIIREICSLLENIEFNLQGGLFAGESLIDFSDKTIKARYANCLGDAIHKIYTKMEFFSFDGGDEEDSCSLPDSNNKNNEAMMDRETNGMPSDAAVAQSSVFPIQDKTSTGISSDLQKADVGQSHGECQLIKALERRERARRFSHFTSRMQNLQRVWVPKQSQTNRPKNESNSKQSRRKKRRTTSHNDMVLETPLLARTSEPRETDSVEQHRGGNGFKKTLSKALFRDEDYPDHV